jgi:hypothetical protein
MFDKNILTFNPGWDRNGGTLPAFDDIRVIQQTLKSRGLALATEADEATSGPASIMVMIPTETRSSSTNTYPAQRSDRKRLVSVATNAPDEGARDGLRPPCGIFGVRRLSLEA